jgi:hypothetical protein
VPQSATRVNRFRHLQFDGQMRIINVRGFDFIIQRIHAIWPSDLKP